MFRAVYHTLIYLKKSIYLIFLFVRINEIYEIYIKFYKSGQSVLPLLIKPNDEILFLSNIFDIASSCSRVKLRLLAKTQAAWTLKKRKLLQE